MKRSEMKSSVVVQSRSRPEGRIFPRRKVAVKSTLLNGVGDFDMELSLAIQESLRYARQREQEQNSRMIHVNGPSDVTKMQGSGKVRGSEQTRASGFNNKAQEGTTSNSFCFANNEVGRLKELVLSQAELIQCQQDELDERKREVKDLMTSNEALQCRLERMERRMSILKQKDLHDADMKSLEEDASKTAGSSQAIVAKGKTLELIQPELKRKRKRAKSCLSHKKHHKYAKAAYISAGGPWKEQEEDSDDEESEEMTSGNEENNGSDEEESNSTDKQEDEDECEFAEQVIDYPIMVTEAPYHLYYPKHVFSCLDSVTSERIPQNHNEVETPSWRLKPLTNMYQLEGTENITDEAYFKRHQKFEMEEKRRKRWDMQRLRELRIFEKQQRQKEDEIRASQDETDVETFLPSVHDLTHIELTDSVPVMAFGQPVPFVSPAEFEIPWDMSSSSQSTTRQKHSSHVRRH